MGGHSARTDELDRRNQFVRARRPHPVPWPGLARFGAAADVREQAEDLGQSVPRTPRRSGCLATPCPERNPHHARHADEGSSGNGVERGIRGQDHDAPAPRVDHRRQCSSAHQKRPEHVDLEDAPPVDRILFPGVVARSGAPPRCWRAVRAQRSRTQSLPTPRSPHLRPTRPPPWEPRPCSRRPLRDARGSGQSPSPDRRWTVSTRPMPRLAPVTTAALNDFVTPRS